MKVAYSDLSGCIPADKTNHTLADIPIVVHVMF